MSRNAEEGMMLYREMFERGVSLVFLKEPHINTDTYKAALSNQLNMTGNDVDLILKGINEYLMRLAEKQIIKYSKDFEGTLKDIDVIRLIGIAKELLFQRT